MGINFTMGHKIAHATPFQKALSKMNNMVTILIFLNAFLGFKIYDFSLKTVFTMLHRPLGIIP
jgi:hypothetical protein